MLSWECCFRHINVPISVELLKIVLKLFILSWTFSVPFLLFTAICLFTLFILTCCKLDRKLEKDQLLKHIIMSYWCMVHFVCISNHCKPYGCCVNYVYIELWALSIFITHDVIIHCYSSRNKRVHYV